MDIIYALAQELNVNEKYVENVVQLLDEGNTIPFIARYRKELHGAMDDTTLRTLEERLQYLRNLEERRTAVKKWIADGISEEDIPYSDTSAYVKKVMNTQKVYNSLY